MPASDESVAEPEDSELAAAATTPAAPPELIGIGAALVDWLMDVDDDFLTTNVDGAKGGMELVDGVEAQENLIQAGEKPASRAAGGAAANTTVGAANLGINAGFIGAVGSDATGNFFRSVPNGKIVNHYCEKKAELPTGQGPVDGHAGCRTNHAHLPWCQHANESDDITVEDFAGAKIVMVEGYSLFNPALAKAIIEKAKAAGCKIAA